jgi:MFS superfamily sulfate permease-like transporter
MMEIFKKWLEFHWMKAFLGLTVTLLAIAFTPFFITILTSIATAAGFLVILYFWLLDDSVEEEYIDSGAPSLGGNYNYATGEVDSGLELGGQYDD